MTLMSFFFYSMTMNVWRYVELHVQYTVTYSDYVYEN